VDDDDHVRCYKLILRLCYGPGINAGRRAPTIHLGSALDAGRFAVVRMPAVMVAHPLGQA
jgi:hypothetical protein